MINNSGPNNLPPPHSGRVLLWYGWRDDPENQDKKWLKKWFVKNTFQCRKMLLAGTRCHRKTVLGSQFCFAHLAKYGLKEVPHYKSNHHSRVIDTITKVVCSGNFFENQKVVPIYGERLTKEEHIKRYQHANRCGPQEFGFIRKSHPNDIIYIDFAQISNSFEYIKFNDNGNCYLDYDEAKNELWVKALHTLYVKDEITIDLNHSKTSVHIIKPATLDNSYFIETFVYRGIPTKYFNLDYDTIIRTDLKGHRREGYKPMN